MPGLLVTDKNIALNSKRGQYSVGAEFIGTFLFALLGSCAPGHVAPWANGLALAILVYATGNISGGHLNPAVTLGAMLTGYISRDKGFAYIIAQVAGAVLAAVVQAVLIPGVVLGDASTALGGFAPGSDVHWYQAFAWELITTFILVFVVFSVALSEPNFGDVGPLIVGLSVTASAFVIGNLTGGALNPARVLGPALVFLFHLKSAWYYVIAELCGGALAALAAYPLYGAGEFPMWDPVHDEYHPIA